MPLNYNFSQVKDHETLHKDESEWHKTDALIWLCMGVGMSNITEANYKEFYARVKFIEKLSGEMMYKGKEPYYFTIDDIKRRIGLGTNVSSMTHHQFVKNKSERFFQDIERSLA